MSSNKRIENPRMSRKISLAKVFTSILKREGYETVYVNLISVKGIKEAAERALISIPNKLLNKLREFRGFLEALRIKLLSTLLL